MYVLTLELDPRIRTFCTNEAENIPNPVGHYETCTRSFTTRLITCVCLYIQVPYFDDNSKNIFGNLQWVIYIDLSSNYCVYFQLELVK